MRRPRWFKQILPIRPPSLSCTGGNTKEFPSPLGPAGTQFAQRLAKTRAELAVIRLRLDNASLTPQERETRTCSNKPSATSTTPSVKKPAAPPSSITPSKPPGSSSSNTSTASKQDKADEAAVEGKKIQLHPRQTLPLGFMGRAQNRGQDPRPHQGDDRR